MSNITTAITAVEGYFPDYVLTNEILETMPLCLRNYETPLKKGNNLEFAFFGRGFTWGAVYVKWAYGT